MSPADETPTAWVAPRSKSAWLVCVQRTAARPTSFGSGAASSTFGPSAASGGVAAPGGRMPLSGLAVAPDPAAFFARRPDLPDEADKAAGDRSALPADSAGVESLVSSSAETV